MNKSKYEKTLYKIYKVYIIGIIVFTFTFATSMTVFATDDPMAVVNNLSNFIFSLIRMIGIILLGFAALQIGLSFKSHDPSQRANGILSLAGGVIITFAKDIIDMITK